MISVTVNSTINFRYNNLFFISFRSDVFRLYFMSILVKQMLNVLSSYYERPMDYHLWHFTWINLVQYFFLFLTVLLKKTNFFHYFIYIYYHSTKLNTYSSCILSLILFFFFLIFFVISWKIYF